MLQLGKAALGAACRSTTTRFRRSGAALFADRPGYRQRNAVSIIRQESAFDPAELVGRPGDGLMQVTPEAGGIPASAQLQLRRQALKNDMP